MKPIVTLLLLLAGLPIFANEPERVAILLHETTQKELAEPLATYMTDVEHHFPVKFQVVAGQWEKPEQVRTVIKDLHDKQRIAGVILVGAMPMHRFFMHDFANPNPLYYEDFDLKLSDQNKDGVDDIYAGKPMLKVWVANLRSSVKENDDDISSLKKFFAKTHAYYQTKDTAERRALAFSGADWPEGGTWFKNKISGKLFNKEAVAVLENKVCTLTSLRNAFKARSYTLVHIQVHSDWNQQGMEDGELKAKEIADMETGALITVNHGCSAGNWMHNEADGTSPNTAMSYVFGKSIGQAVLAQVRSGMIDNQEILYTRLLAGDYLGKAYLQAKQSGETHSSKGDHVPGDIVGGVLMIGNPFVQLAPLQTTTVGQVKVPVTTPSIKQRGIVTEGNVSRLAAVMAKARRGEEICVAAIGGSITAGGQNTKDPKNRYIARVADWFTQTFPKAKVRFVNAGIGGTNSLYGAMRVQRDVLSKKPDLVIVEYAVNDNHPVPMFWGSYEGVLRQILSEPQQPAIVQLFFMQRKGENAQETQRMLGRHYDLPMVSFRDAWWPEIYSGRTKWEDMYDDVVHPNDTGHILASELLIELLSKVNAKPEASTAANHGALPAPMITDFFANCRYTQGTDLKPAQNNGWTQTVDGSKWESPSKSDGAIEFEFSGNVLFVGYDIDAASEPFAKFSIDGGSAQPLKTNPNRLPLAENLSPGPHRVRIEIAGSKVPERTAAKVRIWGIGAAGATE